MANKLFKSIAIGAAAGAAVALLNKQTRQQTIAQVKNATENVKYYAQNTDVLMEQIQDKVGKVQSLYDTYGDELTQIGALTPQVQGMIESTKNAFSKKDSSVNSTVEENDEVIHL